MNAALPRVPCSAVVFAYHNVGARGLRVLHDAGIQVRLVVTHRDNPNEVLWFERVADVAAEYGWPCILPEDPNTPEVAQQVRACHADFVFSLYYRKMLSPALLACGARGAYNMHGSLLPRYRGRAPVNWAVLHGERQTGATLHVMDAKPDHGAIVDQQAVPILGDDTARQVFDKVTLAAEMVLARSLPALVAGTARLTPQEHLPGQYFGGRSPEDGRIPAQASAAQIHNLVRAVAPPDYPGAFFDVSTPVGLKRLLVARTRHLPTPASAPRGRLELIAAQPHIHLVAADGQMLEVLALQCEGRVLDAGALVAQFGPGPLSPVASS